MLKFTQKYFLEKLNHFFFIFSMKKSFKKSSENAEIYAKIFESLFFIFSLKKSF